MDWFLDICLIFIAGGVCGLFSGWKLKGISDEMDRRAAAILNPVKEIMPGHWPSPQQVAQEEHLAFLRRQEAAKAKRGLLLRQEGIEE